MDIKETLSAINIVDVLIVLFLFAMFILGYIQGTIRRLVGIASIVFSFFLSLQLNNVWLGSFLATNWTQYPKEYSTMIGYLVIFVAAVAAFSLVIQGTYNKVEILAKYPVIDEVVGGLLGVVQGFLVLLFLVIILDQFFLYANFPKETNELPFLRDFWTAINGSAFGQLLHDNVIPAFIGVTSFLIPESVRALYGS
ncbi:MAG: CvpA family protein [Candidatus Limnocylindrales bacterium]